MASNSAVTSTPTNIPLVRFATEDDVPTILAMIRELADYEKALHEVEATEASLLATLSFPSNPSKGFAKTLLIFPSESALESNSISPKTAVPHREPRGLQHLPLMPVPDPVPANDPTVSSPQPPKCAGMALYFHNYSTWRSAPGIYLEDLFVRPEFRKRGYGKVLLQRLAQETVEMGGKRLEWSVLKWNQPSVDFYVGKAIGAERMEDWVGMRVEGDTLAALAGK